MIVPLALAAPAAADIRIQADTNLDGDCSDGREDLSLAAPGTRLDTGCRALALR